MLTGQVGVVHSGTGLIARVIEWATRSPAHHVVIAISESTCMSADYPRVLVRPISEYAHVTWTQFELTPEQVEAVVNETWRYLGVRYNLAAFFTLGAHHLTRLPIPAGIAAWLNRRPYVTCSQMTTQIVLAVTPCPAPEVPVVCPGDWYRLLERLGWM